MKKRHLLATAAIAVLIGIFLPATAHAAELKDSDESVVQWENATKEEKIDDRDRTYQVYTLPTSSYNSYDEAVNSLAKSIVDATADRKTNYFWVRFPFSIVTDKELGSSSDLSIEVKDKIHQWIRFGTNMTKKEILAFSGSDWSKHENIDSYYSSVFNWEKTENGYSGVLSCEIRYQTTYDYTDYETQCFNAIKEMNVEGKSDYEKAKALCKWVHARIKDTSVDTMEGQSGMKGMMERKGVCNAFATLACYLGRCLGLDILYEAGYAWNDGHAWNLVKIDNEWYYMDSTCSLNNLSDFLQGNNWLKCVVESVNSEFKDYKEKYNIPDISYDDKHNNCEHEWVLDTSTDSNYDCALPTTSNYGCTKCGAYKWEYYKDPKGHTPGEFIREDYPATCTHEGTNIVRCTVCGKAYRVKVPMTDHHWVNGECTMCHEVCKHSYGERTILAQSTCTTTGSYTETCTICGYVHNGTLAKKAHDYEWVVTTPATCTKQGVETKKCKTCGKQNGQRYTNPTGHDWKTVEVIPATCTSKEKEKQECNKCHETQTITNENSHYADHQWEDGDGTVKCKICKSFTHTHRWVEDTSKTIPATCTSEGSKTYYCTADYKDFDGEVHKCKSTKTETLAKTPHKWKDGKCEVCGATHEHDWQEETALAQSPTCEKAGSKTYKCSLCGEEKTEEVPATGHTWKSEKLANNTSRCKCSVCGKTKAHNAEVVSIDNATCTEAEVIHYVCKDCGHKYKVRSKENLALGHDWKNAEGQCTRCSEKHTHDFGEWKTTLAPTCSKEGEQTRVCNTCGYEESKALAKTNHTPKVVGAKPATCKEEGYTGDEVCKDCGIELKKGTTLAKTNDHKWEVISNTEPNCKEPGKKISKCSVCGLEKTEEIPTTNNHQWGGWTTTLAPTCTKDGERTHKCKICGKEENETVKATGHSWGEWTTTLVPTCTKEGKEVRQCTKCKEEESRALAKTPHTLETVGAKKSTCNSKGYTGDKVCKVCKEVIEKGHELPLAQHSWNSGVITKAPSYTTTGVKTWTCNNCGATKTSTLAKLPMPKAGTKLVVGGNTYVVTKVGAEVSLSKANSKAKAITVPNTVSVGGITYKVTSIGSNAFKNCKKLTTVTIGTNVRAIKAKAFNNCPKLKKVTIKTVSLSGKTASKKSFSKVNKKMVIKVPKKAKKSYAKIFKGYKVK